MCSLYHEVGCCQLCILYSWFCVCGLYIEDCCFRWFSDGIDVLLFHTHVLCGVVWVFHGDVLCGVFMLCVYVGGCGCGSGRCVEVLVYVSFMIHWLRVGVRKYSIKFLGFILM